MNPGKLNKRIEVWGKVTSTNKLKEKTYSLQKIKTIWASIIPQTGKLQNQQAETIVSNTTHKIIVRYSAGKDIMQDMQIRFNNHKFDIKYRLNPYFENKTLEIFVEEVIE